VARHDVIWCPFDTQEQLGIGQYWEGRVWQANKYHHKSAPPTTTTIAEGHVNPHTGTSNLQKSIA
jgi:hypothetical protein